MCASVTRATSCGADMRVPDHDHVGVVRADRERRVLERLTFVDRRARALDAHRVGREALGGELEARRRARRGLVEEVHDHPAAQRRKLLDLAFERAFEAACRGEQTRDVVPRQVGDRDEVASFPLLRRQEVVAHDVDVSHQ